MDRCRRSLHLPLMAVLCSGCFSPWNFRLPTWFNGPPESERRAYQYHDPFPDSHLGPDTGSRPAEYSRQRPPAVGIREKYDGSRIREPFGPGVPPPVGGPVGSQYPQVVPF
jgi:hypothetical protein